MSYKQNMLAKTRSGWGKQAAAVLGALVLLALIIQPAAALAYFFSVTKETVDIYINADGTATLDYVYLFQNQPSGEPIEYVDIGLPSTSYDINSVQGTVDGQPVQGVEKNSDVNGISLFLGSRAIPSGASGEVIARIGTIRRLLFKADNAKTGKNEPYGSFQFNPNYFGSQYVTGQTDMTVTIHLPPGLKTDEPIYFPPENWPGPAEPESGFDSQDRVYYSWHATNASVSEKYTFGAAFPARLVPAGALLTATPNINISFDSICPWIFCLGFVGFLGFTIYGSIVGDKKRKLQYLPPRVAVEGNGIKRGLTAVEAAILMQQPMDKILTMILFSVVKKGTATVVSRDPMKIEVVTPAPEGLDLRPYEQQFLDAMAQPQKTGQRAGLQAMMTDLVKSISEKMRGFSRRDTVAYYQDIMKKAWTQVEQANTPEMKMQMYDDAMDWTMLDRDWDTRTRQTFGPRPVYVPMWWGRFDPGFGRAASSGGGVSTPSVSTGGNRPPQGVSLPNLPGSDMAASMVNGMQAFSAGVVGDLTAFTGGVTAKTNPPPLPTTTRSGGGTRGGGGGHCACACACACAGCACACAGGGR